MRPSWSTKLTDPHQRPIHERFCLPRPGETAPRIETYATERTGSDGVTVIARPVVTRCIECGAETVDGTPVG